MLALPVPPAHSQNLQQEYDLAKEAGSAVDAVDMRVFGASAQAKFGRGMIAADLNDDGADDLIVAAPSASPGSPARSAAGAVYVWFGGASFGGEKDLATTAADLTIMGASEIDRLTQDPSLDLKSSMIAGDVNGDGIDDLVLASSAAAGPGDSRPHAGEAYIIFGRSTFPTMLDLAVQGSSGANVTIYGANTAPGPQHLVIQNSDKLGAQNALAIGDVNGDGIGDLVIGAPGADGVGEASFNCGEAYIIFGRATFPPALDMAVQGVGGADVTMFGGYSPQTSNSRLTDPGALAVSDINGDGVADIVMGARSNEDPQVVARVSSGRLYVVFGRQSPVAFPAAIELSSPAGNRADVVIQGASEFDQNSPSGALLLADVNGDGVADIVSASSDADGPGETRASAGEAYILLGRSGPATFPAVLDLAVQGSGGADVTIYGATANDQLGYNGTIRAADLNGDGIQDIVLGSLFAEGPGDARVGAGEAYIIFGRSSFSTTLDLAVQGAGGASVTLYGTNQSFVGDLLTSGEGTATGDLNGDGIADLMLGALGGFRAGVGIPGNAYVVFGRQSPAVFPATVDFMGPSPDGANVTLFGATHLDNLGNRPFVIGDFNGDGVSDFGLGTDLGDGPPAIPRTSAGEAYVLFGSQERPEIAVEQPAGTDFTSGQSNVVFGTVPVGASSAPVVFTVKNHAFVNLVITGVAVTGGEAGDFSVDTTGMLTTLPGGQETTFSVTFNALSNAPRFTTLRIQSNDPDEAAFDILLAGNVVPESRPLLLNQRFLGLIETTVSRDEWTFTAEGGRSVQFNLLAASAPGVKFSLLGPNGFVGFENIIGDSDLIYLPETGSYTLVAHTDGAAANLSYAFQMDETTVTDIYLASPATGNLHGNRQAQMFRLDLTQGGVLNFSLLNAGAGNRLEMYVQHDTPPTRAASQFNDASGNTANRSMLIPNAAPGFWYVLVYADVVPVPGTYTLEATAPPVALQSVTPLQHASTFTSVVTLTGAGFLPGTVVELLDGATVVATADVSVDSFTQITATFPAGTVPGGLFDVQVRRPDSATASQAAAYDTVSGEPRLETRLITPSSLGRHAVATLRVEYANTGNVPMPAPVLIVKSADADGSDQPILTLDDSAIIRNFWSGQGTYPPGAGPEALILASGVQPGVLAPGERLSVPVHYIGLLQPWDFTDNVTELELRYWTAEDTTPIDWPARKESLRPPMLNETTWNIVFENATASLATNADYVQMLSENARRLAALGREVTDVGELWKFELMQAYGLSPMPVIDSEQDAFVIAPGTPLTLLRRYSSSLSSRREIGPFGRGWYTPWQARLVVENGGDVVKLIGEAGSARVFTRDTRDPLQNRFFPGLDDPDKLSRVVVGTYELSAPGGGVTRFTDGRIAYVEDSNGNRVTATHDVSGRLVSLAHSAGGSVTLAYNASGYISLVSDSVGRTATFAYTGAYLDSKTTDDGKVTAYTYDTTGEPSTRHALTSVSRGGVTRTYTWDTAGRIDSTFLGAAEELAVYSYDTAGAASMTIGGGTTSWFFNNLGFVARTVDALGNIVTTDFDNSGRPLRVVGPTGRSRSFTWCGCGNLTSLTDELGFTTRLAYDDPLKRLTKLTDAGGNVTTQTSDANGNFTTMTFPDSASVQLGNYTAAGLPLTRLNRRGQAITYTYTATGQVDRRTLPDGSYSDYDYDTRGNLVTVTEHPASGPDRITSFLYNHASSGDRLRKATNPDGSWVEYFHDSNGRRQRITDSTGGETRYEFDSSGRLSKLRDASNAVLAEYLYNPGGRTSRLNKGNGTYTTYAYDAMGQLLNLTNFAPDDTLSSQFDYTYDSRGRRTTMTSLDGTWTYSYDATGQLLTATFASINFLIPSRWLEYSYDGLGNRISSSVDFVPTAYTTDALNRYSDIGGTAPTYDADGNLTADGTRTYEYDVLNRLTQVTGPEGVTKYEYDALGNRSATIFNGQRTDYLHDLTGNMNVLAEVPAVGTTRRLVHGFGLISRGAAGAVGYYDFDAIGSTTAVTDTTGTSVNRYAFEPFGATMLADETMPNPFQFIGQFNVQKEAHDLHFMRARFYSSSNGRFTQVDPIGLAGQDYNFQRYAANNPVSLFDPNGLNVGSVEISFFAAVGVGVQGGIQIGDGGINISLGVGVGLGVAGGAGINTSNPGSEWGAGVNAQASFLTGGVSGSVNSELQFDAGASVGTGVGVIIGPQFTTPAWCPWCDPAPGNTPGATNPGGRPPGRPGSPSPGGPGKPGGNGNPNNPQSIDPNEKLGPGVGAPGWIASGALASYRINFENLGPGSRDANGNPFPTFATAPAHRVTIYDQLDVNLDWDTFELTGFGYGDTIIPAKNRSHFTATVPMTYNGETFDVEIEAGIDFPTGRVFVAFQSVNPATSLPPNVLTGFLPPEDGTGIGKGHVSYIVRAKALPHGAEIRNVAEIRFDINDVITTDQIEPQNPAAGIDPAKQALSTVDAVAPASSVVALAPAVVPDFAVNWSGSDSDSGVASYDVYVSEDGGGWSLWQSGTSDRFAVFHGTVGHTYAFYSVARDLAGNVQATPGGAQTSTSTAPAIEPVLRFLPGSTPAHLFIEVTARAGQVVTLEESTDLTAWPRLEAITLTANTATVEVRTTAVPAKRFFRARWTPTP
jgi:RHS repeat-associated protein